MYKGMNIFVKLQLGLSERFFNNLDKQVCITNLWTTNSNVCVCVCENRLIVRGNKLKVIQVTVMKFETKQYIEIRLNY